LPTEKPQVPFDFAQGRLSTTLRSGGQFCLQFASVFPSGRTADPSAALGMTKGRFVPSSTVCDVDGRIVRFALCVQLSQAPITAAKVNAALPFVIPSEAEGSAVLFCLYPDENVLPFYSYGVNCNSFLRVLCGSCGRVEGPGMPGTNQLAVFDHPLG